MIGECHSRLTAHRYSFACITSRTGLVQTASPRKARNTRKKSVCYVATLGTGFVYFVDQLIFSRIIKRKSHAF